MTSHYDAFISYSHSADGKLAPAIQSGLQRLAKPWSKRRALEVFRDETGLTVNPDLWGSITDAMDRSEWFVLLASPEAAQSKWVDQEVERWIDRGPEYRHRILSVVTGGTFAWDDARNTFSADTDAAPPSLARAFDAEPLWTDLSWAHDEHQLDLDNPRFRETIAHIAAPMHGVTQDELIGEDVRQHKRTVLLRRVAVAGLAILTVGAVVASVFAVDNAREADRQAAESRSRELAALAESRMDDDPELAALLAVEALYPESARTEEAIAAHRNTLNHLLAVDHYPVGQPIEVEADVIAISPDGTTLATMADEGPVELWDIENALPLDDEIQVGLAFPSDMSFSPDGRQLLVWGPSGVEIVDLIAGSSTSIEGDTAAAWHPDGTIMHMADDGSRLMFRTDAASDSYEVATVDATITAIVPTVSGRLVLGEAVRGAGWVLTDDGRLSPLATPERGTSGGSGTNAVWVADPREDVVHRYGFELYGSLATGVGIDVSYSVARLPLDADDSSYFETHGTHAVVAGTLVVSDDGAFMAAVDGELEQGLPDSIIGAPDRGHSVHVWHPGARGASFSIATNEARDVAWVPGERTLAIATRRGVEFVRINVDPILSDVWALAVSEDGTRIVTSDGGYTSSIVVRDEPFRAVTARYDGGPYGEGEGDEGPYDDEVSLRPDGRVAAFRRTAGYELVDLGTGDARPVADLADDQVPVAALFSPDGSMLAVPYVVWTESTRETGWLLADAETGDVLVENPHGDDPVSSVLGWSADGSLVYLALSDPDTTSRVMLAEYSVATGETRSVVAVERPTAFAASDQNTLWALGFQDGDVVVVTVEDGGLIGPFPIHPTAVTSVDFSADRQRLLSVGRNVVMTSMVDYAEEWSSDRVPALSSGQRWTLAKFSPDGRTIPMGGAYTPFVALVDFDPWLACASAGDIAFDRLVTVIQREPACRDLGELRDGGTVSLPSAPVDQPPIVTVPIQVAADVAPDPTITDVDAEGTPVAVADPTAGLPDVPAPSFDGTCTSFVDNEQLPLRQDQRGRLVARVQAALVRIGFAIDADGCFGPRTTAAVRDFQTSQGLEVDGIVGPLTVEALVAAAG